MKTLAERLADYGASDYYAFHMPGHKRNKTITGAGLPYEMDITEVEGFDDLHHASGILKTAEERAARLYQAGETHFLVNGSTVGIMSAILGCTQKGGRILAARNCHKSVYHSIFMQELQPYYVYPEFLEELGLNGEVRAKDVEVILEREAGIQAVVIVSPTYDGVVSDVARIAETVHRKGIPLIVDEAHGAHFGFHPYFPKNSNQRGADVVIHSVHKTLPALTQTALIHINGTLVNANRIRSYLDILQSSSPSYLLMAGIDACMEGLESQGDRWFEAYTERLERTRMRLKQLKHLQLIETAHFDKGKLVIAVKHTEMNGKELYKLLCDEFHLQLEMAEGSYVIAMTSVADTPEGFERLEAALQKIDGNVKERKETAEHMEAMPEARVVRTSAQMDGRHSKWVRWEEAVGRISMEYAYIYPPGCPLLAPGEQITIEVVNRLRQYQDYGFTIEGLMEKGKIGVEIDG